jgi:hypothetical protein
MTTLFCRLQALELDLQDFSGFVIDVLPVIRFVFNFSYLKCLKLSSVTLTAIQISDSLFLVPAV